MYIFGGIGGEGNNLNDLWQIDLEPVDEIKWT